MNRWVDSLLRLLRGWERWVLNISISIYTYSYVYIQYISIYNICIGIIYYSCSTSHFFLERRGTVFKCLFKAFSLLYAPEGFWTKMFTTPFTPPQKTHRRFISRLTKEVLIGVEGLNVGCRDVKTITNER